MKVVGPGFASLNSKQVNKKKKKKKRRKKKKCTVYFVR
jgi:hypothetical protein